ncbi:MAG: serine hydrolase [Clostridia bacterium]|nr:serine hydrolase [Clostridia bacterium]MDY5554414.1 serine hydrolase [Blautia sp.]
MISELPKSQRPSRNFQKKARKRKRKRIIRTVLLLAVFILIAGGAYLGINILQGNYYGKPVEAYDTSKVFHDVLYDKENLRSKSFASKLCVSSEGDVDRVKNVSLEQGQKGLLFNLSNHKVLYANGMYDRVYPASITKIMTALLAFKNGNLDETVTIAQEDVTLEDGAQVCGFMAGDKVTLDQLVHCLLVYSGNDAASAIARYIGGTQENFVDMMNSYAAKLGCTGTHFTNPHGLQDEDHYTTPYDIYLMLNAALKYPEFTEISQLPSYTVTYQNAYGETVSTALTATDHYLTGEATAPKDVTILGGKTGTTDLAGNCLALLSQNAYGKTFVSIVMGASSKELLYKQMNSLLKNIN